ncbi:major royal jelly family protein [Erwiniaceae bacterium BAC15a-03b]|uniref:Major royal jelly family protein n=1 Tax=Winslowiella arboricola TaxID=2978220 RepID=A0A9J6PQI4_9GAMM|nr:L-dopachrome tautomerase-related protein [Winslowiella arboricola]MCU5774063.1 major royal jelly family protein [Winslowiella arboricola]MCU5777004.1 major royal jelly family protein [Winslowiella arboricola]
MRRRDFIAGGMAFACLARHSLSAASSGIKAELQPAVSSPWLTNGVAVSQQNEVFINFPRFKGHTSSPALARIENGRPRPFPGNQWNKWQAGDDGLNTLVNINAVHIFDDNLLWVVDQGAPQGEKPAAGAAKLVAFDITSGNVEKIIRFAPHILPEGGAPNDLRIAGGRIFITDSGLGGIIIHDLKTADSRRKLSEAPLLRKPQTAQQKGFNGRILSDGKGTFPQVHSDMLEVSPDGKWLYLSAPTGPLYRIEIRWLLDDALEDKQLESRLEKYADIPSIGGTAIDTKGNIYLSDAEKRAVERLHSDGSRQVIVQDDRLVSPDALFIDNKGFMYVPASQIEYLSDQAGGEDKTGDTFYIYKFALPDFTDG